MPLGKEVGLVLRHIVLDGDPALFPKRGQSRPTAPPFGLRLLWPNGWMDQDATWYEGSLSPGHIVLDGAQLSSEGHTPNFRPMSIVAKRSPISATAEHLS